MMDAPKKDYHNQSEQKGSEGVKPEPKFIHLHVHSEYSTMDGTIGIEELVKKTKAMGLTHVALTDHGNMHGAIEFYSEAKKAGITAILGCELFLHGMPDTLELLQEKSTRVFHMGILAQNTQGYKALLKVVSSGYFGKNLQTVPITPYDIFSHGLVKNNMVGLSGCLEGEFGYLISVLRKLSGKGDLVFGSNDEKILPVLLALEKHVQFWQTVLGEGNYYIELTDNGLEEQKKIIPDLIAAAAFFKLPVVATADAHYLEKDFVDSHILALAIKNGLTMGDLRERLHHTEFHYRTPEEMEELFYFSPEALQNSVEIAKKCSHVQILMGKYFLPKVHVREDENTAQTMRRLAQEGLKQRFLDLDVVYGSSFDEEKKKEYFQRLEYELGVIERMGFADYFLIVSDFIGWAKQQKIPVGPGRGSGAGSLVAYALQITDIDPIPYTLIFERFLNPERVSMPDFDVDFCQWRRDEVIQYCVKKYGEQNVAQITTFGKMQAKAAVKSVGRALNVSFGRMDQFTKLFPTDLGITLKDAINQEARINEAMSRDDTLKECMDYALKLEGLVSHTSVHAAGVVISDGEMTEYVPVYTTDGKTLITQYEMKPTEKVGLVKFDFLGLKTLTVIDLAVRAIHKNRNPNLSINKIPLNDAEVFKQISLGHTCGIFQCEGSGMTQLVLKLKPSTFEDIIALVALFRPGPLGSGMVDAFIERKHGRQAITYLHPNLEPILKDTYGMILYQEQVQKIAAVLASYSLGEADLLRRAMGKKIAEEMAQQKGRFVDGSKSNLVEEKIAEEIFDLMAEFANYGFNKSHSAAYGLVSYQTAYLKTYFPEEFLAASMTCDMDNSEKVVRYVEDCQRLKILVLPPSLNRSVAQFQVFKPKEISFALLGIKGIGEGVVNLIVEEREKRGEFISLTDFAKRINLNKIGKKTLQLLNFAGVFDEFGIGRTELDAMLGSIFDYSCKLFEAKEKGQRSLFDLAPKTAKKMDDDLIWEKRANLAEVRKGFDELLQEKKLLGVFLTSHPLNIFTSDFSAFSNLRIQQLEMFFPPQHNPQVKPKKVKVAIVALLTEVDFRRTKKGKLLVALRLEQQGEFIEGVLFEEALASIKIPEKNTPVLVSGMIDRSFDQSSIRFSIDSIRPLEEVRKEKVSSLLLHLHSDFSEDIDSSTYKIQCMEKIFSDHQGNVNVSVQLHLDKVHLTLNNFTSKVDVTNAFLQKVYKLPFKDVSFSYS